ncbi:MAG: hypothetical protein LBG42_05910 [Treponema sp.]|jgi:hypothetical protein|nr:hypothetical protein [Treponema sp.]
MKRRNIYEGIFLGALLLFMTACAPLLDSPEAQFQAADAGGSEGTVVLSINGPDARTLAPVDELVKYEIQFYKTLDGVKAVEKSLTVTSTGNIQERLEAGYWEITVVGYVADLNGTEVPSVYGVTEGIPMIAGEVRRISVFLDTPVALDAPGYFEYNVMVPGGVAVNYDQTRDAYGHISDGDFIGTSKGDPGDYFSGAVLRIAPDVAAPPSLPYDASHISFINNKGNIFIDLKYGDESPGKGVPRPDPNRLAQGKIELPPGRYTLYLSLVSDRSIDSTSAPNDYIGIFKEEVVYIYPHMTTRTPPAYTRFTEADLTAQVFFEGHAEVSGNAAYTPQKVWIARNNSYAGDDSHGQWSAPITERSGFYEWNLYIPSHSIASTLNYGADGQSVYFRFEMHDGARTLFSPWQEYKTQEKQGQIDIDLYAHIEKVTVPPSVTITTGGVYKDSIAITGDTSVYDVVRGVNFSNDEANKALFNVNDIPNGKAIAYFEARASSPSYSDRALAWRYAASNFQQPSSYPYAAKGKPVVYEIDNAGGYLVLHHESDNSRPVNGADLGDYPVEIATGFFNFNVELTLPTGGNFPEYDRVRLQIRDAATGDLVADSLTTSAASPFAWTIAPANELPVYTYGAAAYRDYSIYNYGGDPNKTELTNYYDYGYSASKGVVFVVVFEDVNAGEIVNSYPLAATRRYTPPELMSQVKLGIASTSDLDGAATQTINANAGVGSRVYDAPEQYYYFAADPGVPYYLEYRDAHTTDFITGNPSGPGLTGRVSVSYRYNTSGGALNRPIATIRTGATAKALVSVIIKADDSGSYRLVKNTSAITPQAAEQTFFIPANDVRYYTFTPSGSSVVYSVGFKGDAGNSNWADVSVNAYVYSDDDPTGANASVPDGARATPTDSAVSYQGGLGFLNPAGKKVLIAVTNSPSSSGKEFKLTIADLSTVTTSIYTTTPAAKSILQNAVQHFVFTPASVAASYEFLYKDTASLTGANDASISSVRLYTYIPGTGGLTLLAELMENTVASPGPFDAGARALIEVEDGSATSGSRNYELTVVQQAP